MNKLWCVTKRKQIKKEYISYEEGEILEIMTKDLTLREAMKLKRKLNINRTKRERQKIYYKADRMKDVNE